jgi:hypothetical protein
MPPERRRRNRPLLVAANISRLHWVQVLPDGHYNLDDWLYGVLDGFRYASPAGRYDELDELIPAENQYLMSFEEWHQEVQFIALDEQMGETRGKFYRARSFEDLIDAINYR